MRVVVNMLFNAECFIVQLKLYSNIHIDGSILFGFGIIVLVLYVFSFKIAIAIEVHTFLNKGLIQVLQSEKPPFSVNQWLGIAVLIHNSKSCYIICHGNAEVIRPKGRSRMYNTRTILSGHKIAC